MIDEKLVKELQETMTVSSENGNIVPDWETIQEVHDLILDHYKVPVNGNILHEFWNRHSDACPLEASEQEKQEREFEEWAKCKEVDFEFATRPLIKYMAENHHPHTLAIVDSNRGQLLEGVKTVKVDDYIVD